MEEVIKMKKELFYNKENANLKLSEDLLNATRIYCEDYKEFLNNCKTERKTCEFSEKLAKEKGFEPFSKNKKYNPGDKVYFVNRNKVIVLVIFGEKSLEEGIKLAVAHIDSPRLDLKPILFLKMMR